MLPALHSHRWPERLFFLTEGQASDYKDAQHLRDHLQASDLLADRGYHWFRNGLKDKGISAYIPPRIKGKHSAGYNKALCMQRLRIENMFRRIKDWRRIATRYLRWAHPFLSQFHRSNMLYWID